jgi:hypothetical protein
MPQERVSPQPRVDGYLVEVVAPGYTWRWSRVTDECSLDAARGITSRLQPRRGHGARRPSGTYRARRLAAWAHDVAAQPLDPALRVGVFASKGVQARDAAIVHFAYSRTGTTADAASVDTCVIGRPPSEQAIFRTKTSTTTASPSAPSASMGTAISRGAAAPPRGLQRRSPLSGAACVGLGGAADGNVLVRAPRPLVRINVRGGL